MSQTAITTAFEQWKAQQNLSNETIILDEFVFALVPGLDVSLPVDRTEALPPEAQIVHRQAVSRTGVVNENAVVFSVVLGADVGDFAFNWIGLVNKASGTLAMVVHAPEQHKITTAAGQQGNVLTRSFLMEFNGAQTETGIHTPAETWQIDFTARMAGMDERQRLENIDIYGAAAFFNDGYLVGKSGGQYFVTSGTGYVAGLRSQLAANENIAVSTKPVKVWLDVSWTGSLVSTWAVQSQITVAATLADYVQNGVQHYVFALASIDTSGNITDLRPKGSLSEQQGNSDYLRKDKNLSDIHSPQQARQSLGLKGAAVLDVGKSAGTVAAGDDTRITGAVQRGGDTMTGELMTTSPSGFRIKYSNRGAVLHFDGDIFYLLFTDKDNQDGIHNDLRPFIVNATTGEVWLANNSGCNGAFRAAGLVSSDKVYAASGNTFLETDGNVYGPVWGGYLSNWLNSQFAQHDNMAAMQAWVNRYFVADVALGAATQVNYGDGIYNVPGGCVMTGGGFASSSRQTLIYRPLQKYIPALGWMTVGHTG